MTRAEQIARLINNNELLSKSLNLIAQCLLKLRRFSEALDQAEKASKLCPNTDMQLEVYMTMGSIYRHSNIGLEDRFLKDLKTSKTRKNILSLH